MAYNGGWPKYVSVAERRAKAEHQRVKLQKKGVVLQPVQIEGRAIASTFWGKAWCTNIEGYQDYANRLARGRSYLRNGSVVDLQISEGLVLAKVSGSVMYTVKIEIQCLAPKLWQELCADVAGNIASIVELLQGTMSKTMMERFCRQAGGLFPKPKEINFSCSCPDSASLCKHVAASMLGIGARLDHEPTLLFRLRAVNELDLMAALEVPKSLKKQNGAATKRLQTDDVSALFGIEMAEQNLEVPRAAKPNKRPAPLVTCRTASKKTSTLKKTSKSIPKQPSVKSPKNPLQKKLNAASTKSSR